MLKILIKNLFTFSFLRKYNHIPISNDISYYNIISTISISNDINDPQTTIYKYEISIKMTQS